jgi:hypothetical protein
MATSKNRTGVGKRPDGANQYISQFGSFKAAD